MALAEGEIPQWPANQVAAGGDRHHDAGPGLRSELSADELGECLGGALGEVEQKLPSLPEDPAQEARHGGEDMTMRNGREHFLLQPLRP
jgi:hypothetical protein